MASKNPEWTRPPVVEVVVAVQFEQLPKLSNGHLGWFWGEMHEDFPFSDDVPPIPPVLESFSGDSPFGFASINLRRAGGDARLRMTSANNTKMIQVQNGWIVANWTKQPAQDYPGFTGVKQLFDSALSRFARFLKERDLGTLQPTLWEITYVDHIPRGTVWDQPEDLARVFPGLFGGAQVPGVRSEAVDATWTWVQSNPPGRLRLSVQSARTSAESQNETLIVRSVARGQVQPSEPRSLDQALNTGRSIVVDAFMSVTSDEAKRYWQGA
jgi:uncharacterized protein (TIGR04255 family)